MLSIRNSINFLFLETMRECESLLIIPEVSSVQNIFVPAESKLGICVQEDVAQRIYTSDKEKKSG